MKLLDKYEVAGVNLFKIEVSEDELDVYECCMKHLHNTLPPSQIEIVCGAYEDELQSIYEQVSILLKKYTHLR